MSLFTLLCGPILRRIEPSRVCIWLATSIQPDVCEASIYYLYRKTGQKDWVEEVVFTKTKYNVKQLGSNLFIILLEITPAEDEGPFKSLRLYGYDIFLQFNDRDKVILNEKDITSKDGGPKDVPFTKTYNTRKQYTYADLPYPVFVIPEQDVPNARIFYGSCRKAHGRGSDALNAADTELEEQWTNYSSNQENRIPDFSLFFLGDQIYADDLNEEVFDAVQNLTSSLMGYEEVIPEYPGIKELSVDDLADYLLNYLNAVPGFDIEELNLPRKFIFHAATITNFREKNLYRLLDLYCPVGLFKSLAKKDPQLAKQKGFKNTAEKIATYGPSGEFSSMDLNEVLPREYLRTTLTESLIKVKDIVHKERRPFLRKNASISTDDKGHLISVGEFAALYLLSWSNFNFKKKNEITVGIQLDPPKEENLEGLLQGNVKVMRLLANVPSYMIFDDHEVTDEWNLDEGWRNAIEKSATGKRLMANGLAAFWAFQGWGNNPDHYPADFITAITDHLHNPLYNQGVDDQSKAKKYEDTLLQFQDWAFIAPTNPVSVFLDNRTLRGGTEEMNYYIHLNEKKKFKAARLMSQVAFDKVENLLKASKYVSDSPIIFCAPTPVNGTALFEKGQLHMVDGSFNSDTKIAGYFPKEPGRYVNDYECWRANPRGKYEFFNFLDTIVKPSNIIILSGDVHYGFHSTSYLYSTLTEKVYQIDQLTSSALKNNTLDKLDKINQLAYVSMYDTKDEVYKEINESYPFPNTSIFTNVLVHFALKGHLVRYSDIIDEDTWLIFKNNIGLLDISMKNKSVALSNLFFYVDYYGSPVIKSKSV